MVLTNSLKNRARDLLDADKSDGQVGTDGTAPTEDDTSLGAAVSGTDNVLTSSTGTKQLVLDYNLLSSEGNGNTLKEFATDFNSGATLGTRITFPSIVKTQSVEVQISTIVDFP